MDLTLKEKITTGTGSDIYYLTGEIVSFHNISSSVVPSGWLSCDGSQLLISNYQNLYNAIGYRYTSAAEQSSSPTFFRLPKLNNIDGTYPTHQTNQWQSGGVNWIESYTGHTHTFNAGTITYATAAIASQSGETGHAHNAAVVNNNQSITGHMHNVGSSFNINTNGASSSGNYTGSNRQAVLSPQTHVHNGTGSVATYTAAETWDHAHTNNASTSTGSTSATETHSHTATLNVNAGSTGTDATLPTVITRYIIKV